MKNFMPEENFMTGAAKRTAASVATHILIAAGVLYLIYNAGDYLSNDFSFYEGLNQLVIDLVLALPFFEIYSRSLRTKTDEVLYKIHVTALCFFLLLMHLRIIVLWPLHFHSDSHFSAVLWKGYLVAVLLLIVVYAVDTLLRPGRREIAAAKLVWPFLYVEATFLFWNAYSPLAGDTMIVWFATLIAYAVITLRQKELHWSSAFLPLILSGSVLGGVFFCL